MSPQTNNVAFTSPINPPGVSPTLNRAQIWAGLLIKIRSAQTFVPAAIQDTTVHSTSTDAAGNQVTKRSVIFIEGQREVHETVTAYEHTRVEFEQPDGSHVTNLISEGAEGELYMTYVFEWRHPDLSAEEFEVQAEKERKMSKMAVEGTIKAMRKLLEEGKI